MLRNGSSLPEIGQILGHRSPQSTAIYAKVDLPSLRTLLCRGREGCDDHTANVARDYLAMRRGLGFKLRDAGAGLLDFVSFVERANALPASRRVLLWSGPGNPNPPLPMDWARRLSFVRGFARYLNAIDSRSEIPPKRPVALSSSRAPTVPLHTEQQIEQLLAAALTLPPAGGLRRWTYHCLLGLFTVTGLRLGEALSLKLDDIDLHENVLDNSWSEIRQVPPDTDPPLHAEGARRLSPAA